MPNSFFCCYMHKIRFSLLHWICVVAYDIACVWVNSLILISFFFFFVLCISPGKQLLYYHPFVYHWSVSSSSKEWIQMLPNLAAVARGAHITQPPWSRSIQLLTSDQLAIISFAKSRQFGLGESNTATNLSNVCESILNGTVKQISADRMNTQKKMKQKSLMRSTTKIDSSFLPADHELYTACFPSNISSDWFFLHVIPITRDCAVEYIRNEKQMVRGKGRLSLLSTAFSHPLSCIAQFSGSFLLMCLII